MDVLMPQLGETVAEGKIVRWFKSPGDMVMPGDNLFEIETDKTSMEVPSTVAGTLTDIRFQVGETAKVGAVVAVISAAGEAPQARPVGASRAPSASAVAGSERGEGALRASGHDGAAVAVHAYTAMSPWREVRTPERNYGPARLPSGTVVTPLARRLAGERGVDLTRIRGSGPHGRIMARDVESAARLVRTPEPEYAHATDATRVKALFERIPYDEVPLDAMRRTIAARLVVAKQTIPHFYVTTDIEIERLVALRQEANAAAPKDERGEPIFKLSLNDFMIKAWAVALRRVPAANAVFANESILRFRQSDIGVAVALEGGLVTPIVRNADSKSLVEISAEMRELIARARARKLRPEEYQGGASTISNLGMYGVREFSAIINPPHATVLAVGSARRAPVETNDGGVKFVDQMTVTLSCDHRVVDGALGAELLSVFKALLEKPIAFLV